MIIYLPGNSSINKKEKDLIVNFLESKDLDVYDHEWLHWRHQDMMINIPVEVERIVKMVEEEKPESVTLIGKSIGTYVILMLLGSLRTKVDKVIMLGIPSADLSSGQQLMYPQILDKVNVPMHVIQNTNDPHGSAEQVKQILSDIDYSIEEIDASTHEYEYPEKVFAALN